MGKRDGNVGMTPKEKMILISIVLGTFMAALDVTIVAVALPTMAIELSTPGNTGNVSWILLGYTLAICCLILFWGKLGSNIGYKKVFLTGVVVFTVFSALIGLGGTIGGIGLNAVILMRIAQGIGGGMLTSMGLAMVSSYLPGSKGFSVGIITLAASAGTAFGPALGGVLCNFHWSYIFFINVPIGILCLLMSTKYMAGVKEKRDTEKKKLDLVGVVLMVIMMFSLIYYLNVGKDIGWMSHEAILLISTLFISAGCLAWWEQRARDPMIPLRLIGTRDILRGNIVALCLFAAMAGTYLLMPYYLQGCLGYTTVEMGLILIANSLGMMVVGPTVGRISDRTGLNKRFVSIGCLVTAAGFFLMTMLQADSGLWYILLSLFVMGMGIGIALVSCTNLCLGHSKESESGQVSGLINTFRQAGSTAGVAILEAVFASAIIVPAVIDPSDLDWLMSGFKPAFFVALLISFVAFFISMTLRDKPREMNIIEE